MHELPFIEKLIENGVYFNDITNAFYDNLGKNNIAFFDVPVHMNAEGNMFVAKYIFDDLENDLKLQLIKAEQREHKNQALKGKVLNELQEKLVNEYICKQKEMLPKNLSEKKVGAIGMNCDPFTCGHRYLVEEALKEMDLIVIFLVEEDNSYFSFKDRYEMVKNGVEDLENVYVLPSGQFIGSAYTIPDYIFRGMQKHAYIDMSLDIEIFAQYIVPGFNIIKRFVGTEAVDEVTYEYNQSLKQILPNYGVEVGEIQRLKSNDTDVSAKVARRLLEKEQFDELSDLLPVTTIDYLKSKK